MGKNKSILNKKAMFIIIVGVIVIIIAIYINQSKRQTENTGGNSGTTKAPHIDAPHIDVPKIDVPKIEVPK